MESVNRELTRSERGDRGETNLLISSRFLVAICMQSCNLYKEICGCEFYSISKVLFCNSKEFFRSLLSDFYVSFFFCIEDNKFNKKKKFVINFLHITF